MHTHVEQVDEAVETVRLGSQLKDLRLVLWPEGVALCRDLVAGEEGVGGEQLAKLRLHTHLLRDVSCRDETTPMTTPMVPNTAKGKREGREEGGRREGRRECDRV